MGRVRAVLSVLSSQKATVIFLLLSVLGPLGLHYRPSGIESGPDSPSELFPDVSPFYEMVSGEQVWSHFNWREVQAAAVKSGSEQGLWLTSAEGFAFLPRGMPAHRQAEPNQPENLHEIAPQLGQLSLDRCQLEIEDWQDLGHLQQLRLFECFHVLPPPGKFADGVSKVAESLSTLPALRQLNLLGSGWIRLGSMPALETLILEAADLRRVIAGDELAVQFPQLQTLVLRLRPGESVSEGGMGVLQRLQQHPKLRRVELITGVPGQRGFLNTQITALQDQLPGLTVCRGETGFTLFDGLAVILLIFLMLCSQCSVSTVLWSLAIIPQAATLPDFLRTIRGVLVGFAVSMLFSGFLTAQLLEIRWYFPVCLSLLAVSLPGVNHGLTTLLSSKQRQALAPLWSLAAFIPQLLYGLPESCFPLIFGDLAWFNAGLLIVSALAFFVSLSAMGKPYAWLQEQGEPGARLIGMNRRERAAEQLRAAQLGTVDPSPRLLSGSFSDRLRAGTTGVTPKQLRVTAFTFIPCLIYIHVTLGKNFIWTAVCAIVMSLFLPLLMRSQTWVQRRRRLSIDFLMPAGRDDFWRHFRSAIFWDFSIALPVPLAGWVAANIYRDSFSQYAAGLLLQLLLHACATALLYGLTVLTLARPRTDWRRYLFFAIILQVMFLMFLDILAQWCVPGSPSFSTWILSVFVATAAAGVVLLVKLPGMLRRLELP